MKTQPIDLIALEQLLKESGYKMNIKTRKVEKADNEVITSRDIEALRMKATDHLGTPISHHYLSTLLRFSSAIPDYEPAPPISKYFKPGYAEYTVLSGRPYVILWKKTGADLSDKCPFCGSRHGHGSLPGHRSPHCSRPGDKTLDVILASDGTVLKREDGYIIRYY